MPGSLLWRYTFYLHGTKPVVIVSVSLAVRATFGWGQAKYKCYLMASQHEREQAGRREWPF